MIFSDQVCYTGRVAKSMNVTIKGKRIDSVGLRKRLHLKKCVQRDVHWILKEISDDDNTFVTCKVCKRRTLKKVLTGKQFVCPICGHHYPVGAYYRLSRLVDRNSFNEFGEKMYAGNMIDFPGYIDELKRQMHKTGLTEAVITGECFIGGVAVIIVVLDCRFLMGSMGSVVGEKITRAIEKADQGRNPIIVFSASGGARMQEGIFSLMQMAKTTAAIKNYSDNGGLYISCLTNPTMGGVTASFAMLGDVIIAEPNALIGFAGPRVIEETIRNKLPDGFQRSEFLQERGFIDKIVTRNEIRKELIRILKLHGYEKGKKEWSKHYDICN